MAQNSNNRQAASGSGIGGIEIGAVSVKWVYQDGENRIVSAVRSHEGNPRQAVLGLFKDHAGHPFSAVCTGQASRALLDLPYRSETECLEKAMGRLGTSPDILLSLGGETFSVYPVRNGTIRNIISSSKCAAGTGEFIVQQFRRMGMAFPEDIASCGQGRLIELATRCSVHCKSDATHKLNKGECRREDVALTLIHGLAAKVCELIESAQWPTGTVLVAGGVSRNRIFVERLRAMLPSSEVTVLPESPYLEAYGALLYAKAPDGPDEIPDLTSRISRSPSSFERLPPLESAEPHLDYRVAQTGSLKIRPDQTYILGVDAGSTTTKAVLFNTETGDVDASCYLRTLGNPIAATRSCLHTLLHQMDGIPFTVSMAATTGSGREMVSVFLSNCPNFNEILAHARAAVQEVPNVDTVFEIGGQDSKFISFLNGIPVDYAMNEGCSAGTGSFLEESASVDMGIDFEQIAAIAEDSTAPIAFGERCAAFINTDLRNALQQGADKADVIAGLAYSIADNYISRIVGPRQVGRNLLFLGGVALNRAVCLAMAARMGRPIVVPPHPELMGSVGAALMAKDRLEDGRISSVPLSLESLSEAEMSVKGTFRCRACENHCEIQRLQVADQTFSFGGLCSRYAMLRQQGKGLRMGRDLVGERNRLMFEDFRPEPVNRPKGVVGLPMAMTTYALFPFYAELVGRLGYTLMLSRPSKPGNKKALASICYPGEIAHGAVHNRLSRGVDYILLSHTIEMAANPGSTHSYTCPSTAVIPNLVKAAFPEHRRKILSPHLSLRDGGLCATMAEIERMGKGLGLDRQSARAAGEAALAHYQAYRAALRHWGETALEDIGGQPTVVLAGRPYSVYAGDVNLALPRKITSRGYHCVPADMLPPMTGDLKSRDVWHFTQQISNAIAYTNARRNAYICLVSCFSCGPDASMLHLFRQELAGRTFCYLEIDSHTAHAGFETRISAFLDIIEERQKEEDRRSKPREDTTIPNLD